jgi:hypothetical protein
MSLFYRLWWQNIVRLTKSRMSSPAKFSCTCFLVVLSLSLAACSIGGSSRNTPTSSDTAMGGSSANNVALSSLHWCGAPSQVFRDQASSQSGENVSQAQLGPADGKPRTITDWNIVKANLGFTLYLPETMPSGTCLLSVSSSLRDPVFGSNFTITYLLSNHSPISFSLAPVRNQHTSDFQCNVSQQESSSTSNSDGKTGSVATATAVAQSKQSPLQLCTGVRDKTSIVFSAQGQTSELKQVFQNLQPNVDWMPAK